MSGWDTMAKAACKDGVRILQQHLIENRTKPSAETREAPVVSLISAEESDFMSGYCTGKGRS